MKWKTAFDLANDNTWERKFSSFTFSGRTYWQSAVFAPRARKIIVSRIVESGGKELVLGVRYITQYVEYAELVSRFETTPKKDTQ